MNILREYREKKRLHSLIQQVKKKRKFEGIEKYALMRTKEMLEKANMALVILDVQRTYSLDEKIAGLVDEYGLGTIIVFK